MSAPAASRPVRRLAGIIGRALLTLVLLEVTCRLWFRQGKFSVHPAQELTFDPLTGWKGVPGFRDQVFHGPLPATLPEPVEVAVNSDGFRDDSWDEKLQRAESTHSRKVLFLGDSLAYGFANPASHRLSEVTEDLGRLNGLPIVAFNAGIPAFGTGQQFRVLPLLLSRIKPDLVVMVATDNDWAESSLPYDHRFGPRVYKPYYSPDGTLALFDTVPQRPSLRAAEYGLDFLALWKVVDLLSYRLEDTRWQQLHLPPWQPLGWQRFEELFALPDLPDGYAEFTESHRAGRLRVRNLLQHAQEISRAEGSDFLLIGPQSLKGDFEEGSSLRESFISFGEFSRYRDFFPVQYDGHPNALWSWMLGQRVVAHLAGKPVEAPLSAFAAFFEVPATLDLRTDLQFRYLFGEWSPATPEGRYGAPAGFALLRSADDAPRNLEITFARTSEEILSVRDLDWKELCTVSAAALTARCGVHPQDGVVFVRLVPLAFSVRKVLEPRASIVSLSLR